MPTSKIRNKKKQNNQQTAASIQKHKAATELAFDFLAEVGAGIQPSEYSLINLLYPEMDGLKEHFYILSRNAITNRLEEHTEGKAFQDRFIKAIKRKPVLDPARIVVGFFDKDQVEITTEGLAFHTPKMAFKWVIQNSVLLPEDKPLNWNGFDVLPGHVAQ